MHTVKQQFLYIQLSCHWRTLLRLRRRGMHRMHKGVSYQDKKLQRWSDHITALGLQIHRLEQQFLA